MDRHRCRQRLAHVARVKAAPHISIDFGFIGILCCRSYHPLPLLLLLSVIHFQWLFRISRFASFPFIFRFDFSFLRLLFICLHAATSCLFYSGLPLVHTRTCPHISLPSLHLRPMRDQKQNHRMKIKDLRFCRKESLSQTVCPRFPCSCSSFALVQSLWGR